MEGVPPQPHPDQAFGIQDLIFPALTRPVPSFADPETRLVVAKLLEESWEVRFEGTFKSAHQSFE